MYGTAFGYFLRQFLLLFSQEVCEYMLQLIFGNLVSTCMEYQGEGCILKKRGSFAWSMKSTWFLMMVKEFVGGCLGGGGGVHGELKGLKHLKCEEQSFQRSGL